MRNGPAMANSKKLTVRYLRDLARKYLGKGRSGLKTRDELLAALKKFIPGQPESAADLSGNPAPTPAPTPGPEPAHRAAPTVERVPPAPPPMPAPAPAPTPAEPLVEGFFVARVFGEGEARSHHLTEAQLHPTLETRSRLHHEELLSDLPDTYQDDRVVLLARDPHSAFLYWDFHPDTVRAAFDLLPSPRVILKVFEDGSVISTLDAALESRGFYLHGLAAAKVFRAEVHAVGSDGVSRRIGPSSNAVRLPADDVSADRSVRFMRVPWGVPLKRLRERLAAHPPAEPPLLPAEVLTITHARWVPGANSGSWQLQLWNETLLQGHAGRELGGGFPFGGASSWTLGGGSPSSWWSSKVMPEPQRPQASGRGS